MTIIADFCSSRQLADIFTSDVENKARQFCRHSNYLQFTNFQSDKQDYQVVKSQTGNNTVSIKKT